MLLPGPLCCPGLRGVAVGVGPVLWALCEGMAGSREAAWHGQSLDGNFTHRRRLPDALPRSGEAHSCSDGDKRPVSREHRFGDTARSPPLVPASTPAICRALSTCSQAPGCSPPSLVPLCSSPTQAWPSRLAPDTGMMECPGCCPESRLPSASSRVCLAWLRALRSAGPDGG